MPTGGGVVLSVRPFGRPFLQSLGRARRWAAWAVGRLGGLVNNAAIDPLSSLPETDEHLFDRVFAVSARGAFFCAWDAIVAMTAIRAHRTTAPSTHPADGRSRPVGRFPATAERSWRLKAQPAGRAPDTPSQCVELFRAIRSCPASPRLQGRRRAPCTGPCGPTSSYDRM